MRNRILALILGVALLFVFIPDYTFADTTVENSDPGADWGITQDQDSEPIACEADINPELRETPIKLRGTGATLTEQRAAAHTKLRYIMDNYADTDYYRTNRFGISEEDAAEAAVVAEQATAGLTTDYEKIQAIYELVAENIYYDVDFYTGVTSHTNQYYKTWTAKIGVCAGYAQVCTIFLNSINIPCIYATGYNHAYNAAYDSQNKRWIFFDSTWGSANRYVNGEKKYGGHNNNYFDMSVTKIASLQNHEFYTDLIFYNMEDGGDVNYGLNMPSGVETWPDLSLWRAEILSPKNPAAQTINIGPVVFEGISVAIGARAFKDCSNLKNLVIPEGITYIGDSAFNNCTGLTDISIPQSITSIGTNAFYNCSSLTDISIPQSVTSIGGSAFCNCSSLTAVTLPESLAEIKDSTFRGCISLTAINIPEIVKSIGTYAFYGCTALKEISLPEGLRTLGQSLFQGCSSLSSLDIPDSVETIGRDAFRGCKSLTELIIPEKVTRVEDGTFYGCTGLTVVTIPEKVTSIGGEVFYGCTGLTDIDLAEGLTHLGDRAFYGCSGLTEIDLPDSLASIGTYAFRECTGITSLTFPNSITEIKSGTAYNCSNLTSVTIGNEVTAIGGSTFYGCSNLTSISIPESVSSIGEYAFWYCTSLKNITIPEGVTRINKSTFSGCSNMTDVLLPDSLKAIDASAFNKCTKLTQINIPESVNIIGDNAFNGCGNLKEVKMPETMTSIGKSAFSGCGSLTGITIPRGIVMIDYRTFYNCNNLLKAVIPEDVTDIDPSAFSGCNAKLCIYCVKNSYAHSFAEDNGINYSLRTPLEDCVISLEQEEYHTTGKPIKPVIKVSDGNTVLTEGEQYSVSVSDAAVGDTFAIVRGLDNYFGEVKVYFTISDHNWSTEYITDTEPTCTEDGIESIHCTDCGAIKEGTERAVEKTGHSFGDWITVSAPSCTEEGSREAVCANCGEKITESIPSAGHDWEDNYTVDKQATCEDDGIESIHCSNCDEKKEARTIPATGHTEIIMQAVEPTCSAEGHTQGTKCAVCGKILDEPESIPKTAHHFEFETTKATLSKNGSIANKCTECGEIESSTVIYYPKSIKLSSAAYTYNGKVRKPAVTVKDANGDVIDASNYTVTYAAGRKNVGSYKVTIKMGGDYYSGTKTLTFKINPKGTSIKTLTPYSKALTVKWVKQAAKMSKSVITGYEIQFATDKKFTKNVKKVAVSKYTTVSKKVTNLKAKTTYYVRIRTYKTVSGTKYYSPWSEVKIKKTK